MSTHARVLESKSVSPLVDALLAEYRTLREEVGRLQDHQNAIMNFATVLLVALATVAAALHENQTNLVRAVLFLTPWAFFLLGAAYSDRTAKLLLAAYYVHNDLRPQISQILETEVWEWENFKRRAVGYDRLIAWLLDKTRWLMFVLPAFFATAFFAADSWPPTRWNAALITADLIALALAVYCMFLVDESSGIPNRRQRVWRPEQEKDVRKLASYGLLAFGVLQFSVVGLVTRNHLVLLLSLAVACLGLALTTAKLLYYSNTKLEADDEHVYAVNRFGHVKRIIKLSNPRVHFAPRTAPWRANRTITIGGGKPNGCQLRFKAWADYLEIWKPDSEEWVRWPERKRGDPPSLSEIEDLFKAELSKSATSAQSQRHGAQPLRH